MVGSGLAGLGTGALVAAQVGPIWLLCVRCSLRKGFRTGAAVALGAAAIDSLYAILGVLGAAVLLASTSVRLGLGLLGAAVLLWIGLRTIADAFRVRLGAEVAADVGTPRQAFLTALAATASNPLTILTWAALFSAASTAALISTSTNAAACLAGVALGSAGFMVALSALAARVGGRLSDRTLQLVDLVSGASLVAFASALAVRTVRAP